MTCSAVLVSILMLQATHSAASQQARAPLAGMDANIERARRAWGVAGVAVAVVKDDTVVYARGFGVREAGKSEPVDANTIFAIGSNTKLFTAVAAGMLVDDGRLRWDDLVSKYLPDFRLYDPLATRDVTLRDLLTHRTGLGDQRGNMVAYGSAYDRREVLRRMRCLTPASSFRSHFAYQNLGFLAAGEMIASSARQSWDELIHDRIFRPLGMSRSSTSVRELEGLANVATPHAGIDRTLTPVSWRNIDNIGPAGSINSTAVDMAKWLRFLLAGGRNGTEHLLQTNTLREIETPQIAIPCAPDSLRSSVHFCAYGLGVLMNDYRGVKVLSHTGGIDGMLSDVTIVPELRLGIVVLTNTDGHNALFAAIAREILDEYLRAPKRDWSSVLLASALREEEAVRGLERSAEQKRVKGTRPSLDLHSYEGRYSSELYGDIAITFHDGRLVFRYGATLVGELEYWSFDTFKVNWQTFADRHELGPSFITFDIDPFGAVASFRIRDDVTRPAGQGAWDSDLFTRQPAARQAFSEGHDRGSVSTPPDEPMRASKLWAPDERESAGVPIPERIISREMRCARSRDGVHSSEASSMKPDARRLALREFLKRCRARLRPADVGLRSYGRRRVAGLRRTEVAELVGVSSGWYELFEMGTSDRNVSISFVQRVAESLRLDSEEAATLYRLALPEVAAAAEIFERSAQDGALQHLASVRQLARRVGQASSFVEGTAAALEAVQSILSPDCISVANLTHLAEDPIPVAIGPRANVAGTVLARTVLAVNEPVQHGGAVLCEHAPDDETAKHHAAHPVRIVRPDGTSVRAMHEPPVDDYRDFNSGLRQRSSLIVGLFERGMFRGNLVAFWSQPRLHSMREIETMLTISSILELSAHAPQSSST